MGRWAVLVQNLIQNHCGAVLVAGGGGGGGYSWGLHYTKTL